MRIVLGTAGLAHQDQNAPAARRRTDAAAWQPRSAQTTSAYHRQRLQLRRRAMCRNIKTLFNFEPPATELEIRDASLQFVRKLSGFTVPSKANEQAFDEAVAAIAAEARKLIASLVTSAQPRNRETEALKARERSAARFG